MAFFKNRSENMGSTYRSVTQSPFPKKICSLLRYVKYIIKAVLTLDVLVEIPAMLNYGKRLEQVRAKQLVTSRLYVFVSYDNRQSSKGFNSNSLYGEAHHQMFIIIIIIIIIIVNFIFRECHLTE